MTMILEGIRILDWTIWQQGPVATALLGDMGAEVIKIEDRGGGDPGRGIRRVRGISAVLPSGRNFYFENNNHNKKSITIDLKKDKGKEIVYRLVKISDVFLQNFRKGVASRMGLGYETLSKYNPKLIYATASGYGPNGPDSGRTSMDLQGLARSGIMHTMGEPDMPPLGIVGGIADQTGAIMVSYGILAALLGRERLGIGQEIDVSQLSSMITLQGCNVAATVMVGKDLPRESRVKTENPLWNRYRCKDDEWICLAHLQSDRYWEPICDIMGIGELKKDPRFESMDKRAENCSDLIAIFDKTFATRTYAEWDKLFQEQGDFIYNKVQRVTDLPSDPQVLENDYIVDYAHPVLGDIKMVGFPVKFSRTPASIRIPAPELGEHTELILNDICGYSWDEIGQLREEEVI